MLYHLIFAVGLIQPLPDNTVLELPPREIDIAAMYSFTQEGPHGQARSGLAVIVKKDDVYLVRYVYGNGVEIAGVGMREADYLYVGWTHDGAIGICRYRIERKNGLPHLIGDRGTSEVLTFFKPVRLSQELDQD